ncbi:MAG: class I SAM-dependent methyltransferase [Acidimicrobiales bacterium]
MTDDAANPWLRGDVRRGADYDRRFDALAASGADVHGEATFVGALGPRTVLDAGCGTGRVAIELARRGLDVVGVDLDPAMLTAARSKAPDLTWVEGDLAEVDLGRTFDVVVMAGNVLVFVVPGTEAQVLVRMAAHLSPAGLLVAGFTVTPERLDAAHYDRLAEDAGLELLGRWATWDRRPYLSDGDYAVSLHHRTARGA